eukprot:gene4786-9540_t
MIIEYLNTVFPFAVFKLDEGMRSDLSQFSCPFIFALLLHGEWDMGDKALLGEGNIEASVGITAHANSSPGFTGILKERYTDFIVREVNKSGEIARLSDISIGKCGEYFAKEKGVSPSDFDTEISTVEALIENFFRELETILPTDDKDLIERVSLFILQAKSKSDECDKELKSFPCTSKDIRTKLHNLIRKYFTNDIETETLQVDNISYILLKAKHKLKRCDNTRKTNTWPKDKGDFIQFILLKENIDTMSAANIIAKNIRTQSSNIHYAGTKDKRAITTQWCTIYRKKPEMLLRLNNYKFPPIIRVGNFDIVKKQLELGDLSGNRFEITLRDVKIDESIIQNACENLSKSGFINYYGLQRFGKGGSGSHDIGREIFKKDYRKVIQMLFTPRDGDKDEIIQVKNDFHAGNYISAFKNIHSSMYAEKAVLQFLVHEKDNFNSAFQYIPKNTRLLCVHAYQSYIWNIAVSARIEMYGLKCVAGDLIPKNNMTVILDERDDVDVNTDVNNDINSSDEIPLNEGRGYDSSISISETRNENDNSSSNNNSNDNNTNSNINSFQRAGELKASDIHIITQEEAENGIYSIKDVILPIVGSQIILPDNAIGELYTSLLAKDGMTLDYFKDRSLGEYRMTGAYRRLLQFPSDFQWRVIYYDDPKADLVETELTRLRTGGLSTKTTTTTTTDTNTMDTDNLHPGQEKTSDSTSTSSASFDTTTATDTTTRTYATMMLRELTKESTETTYQAQLTTASSNASTNANVISSMEIGINTQEESNTLVRNGSGLEEGGVDIKDNDEDSWRKRPRLDDKK